MRAEIKGKSYYGNSTHGLHQWVQTVSLKNMKILKKKTLPYNF